jgi:hypothetical protein
MIGGYLLKKSLIKTPAITQSINIMGIIKSINNIFIFYKFNFKEPPKTYNCDERFKSMISGYQGKSSSSSFAGVVGALS